MKRNQIQVRLLFVVVNGQFSSPFSAAAPACPPDDAVAGGVVDGGYESERSCLYMLPTVSLIFFSSSFFRVHVHSRYGVCAFVRTYVCRLAYFTRHAFLGLHLHVPFFYSLLLTTTTTTTSGGTVAAVDVVEPPRQHSITLINAKTVTHLSQTNNKRQKLLDPINNN